VTPAEREGLVFREPTQTERAFLRIVTHGYEEFERQIERCEIAEYDIDGWCFVRVAVEPRGDVPRRADGPYVDLEPFGDGAFPIVPAQGVVSYRGGVRTELPPAERPVVVGVHAMLWAGADGRLETIEILNVGDGCLVDPYAVFVRAAALDPPGLRYPWTLGAAGSLRVARRDDVPALTALIERSVRALQSRDYGPDELAAALASVYHVDTALIDDGSYYVIEFGRGPAACGGWSRFAMLHGGDRRPGRDERLDPALDAARIRAFYVDPDYARRGVGTRLLAACEDAARAAGFRRFELGATVTGERFFEKRGYAAVERVEIPLPNGLSLPIVVMRKDA
jgi:GNAT superfamily N-acetyltransferase